MASPTIAHSDLGHNNSTGSASLVINVGFAVPSKDTVVVAIQHDSSKSISTIVDSQGNVYTKQTTVSQNGSGQAGQDVWIARIKYPLTATDTITITPSASSSIAAQAIHITGAVSTAPPGAALGDVVKNGVGTATNTPTTGASGTLAVADELSLGFACFTGNTSGFSSDSTGYTSQQTVGNASGSLHYGSKAIAATASPGTETYAPTLTGTPANSSVSLITLRGSTVRYVNVASGSDANSGLVGSPAFNTAKLTIAASGALAGDVVHVLKTTDPASGAGTATFTTGSTSVATTSDLTGSIAAKDLVSTTADGTGGWWEVSAITSSTITLVTAYRPGPAGLTGSGLTIYKLTSAASNYVGFNTAGNIQAFSVDGNAYDPITVTGGYNTSDVRDGFTWMANTNATRQGILACNKQFQNIGYIGMARTARAFSDASGLSTGSRYDHCQAASSNGEGFYSLASGASNYANCVVQVQGNQDGFSHAAGVNANSYYDTCYVLNCGTNSGFNDTQSFRQTFLNCAVDGATTGFILHGQYGLHYTCTANHTTQGYQQGSTHGGDVRLIGCSSSNASSADYSANTSVEVIYMYLFNCIGNSSTVFQRSTGVIQVDKYQQTNGDYRSYQSQGTILTNTSQFRTASPCLEIQPGQGLNIISSMGVATNSDFTTRINRFIEQNWPIPVDAAGTRTVTVYVKKSSTYNGFGPLIGLMVNGYWVGGALPTNYGMLADSNPVITTSYQAYTFTYNNASGPDQVIELSIWVDGTAGSIYVDDISWT